MSLPLWNEKKSGVIAVLPAASRDTGRVVTCPEPRRKLKTEKDAKKHRGSQYVLRSSAEMQGAIVIIMLLLFLIMAVLNGLLLLKIDNYEQQSSQGRIRFEVATEEVYRIQQRLDRLSRDIEDQSIFVKSSFAEVSTRNQNLELDYRTLRRGQEETPKYTSQVTEKTHDQ